MRGASGDLKEDLEQEGDGGGGRGFKVKVVVTVVVDLRKQLHFG